MECIAVRLSWDALLEKLSDFRGISSRSSYVSGAAFSKHLIHLYAYAGPNDLRQHLEVFCTGELVDIKMKA